MSDDSIPLTKILKTADLKLLFSLYLEEIVSIELLDFYNEVEKFKLIREVSASASKARVIVDNFLDASASRGINVSGNAVLRVRKKMEAESYDHTLFNQLQDEAFNLMDTLLPSFKKSDIWNKDRMKLIQKGKKKPYIKPLPPLPNGWDERDPQGMPKSASMSRISYDSSTPQADQKPQLNHGFSLKITKPLPTPPSTPPQQGRWERPTISKATSPRKGRRNLFTSGRANRLERTTSVICKPVSANETHLKEENDEVVLSPRSLSRKISQMFGGKADIYKRNSTISKNNGENVSLV